jgi:hypothetical protein
MWQCATSDTHTQARTHARTHARSRAHTHAYTHTHCAHTGGRGRRPIRDPCRRRGWLRAGVAPSSTQRGKERERRGGTEGQWKGRRDSGRDGGRERALVPVPVAALYAPRQGRLSDLGCGLSDTFFSKPLSEPLSDKGRAGLQPHYVSLRGPSAWPRAPSSGALVSTAMDALDCQAHARCLSAQSSDPTARGDPAGPGARPCHGAGRRVTPTHRRPGGGGSAGPHRRPLRPAGFPQRRPARRPASTFAVGPSSVPAPRAGAARRGRSPGRERRRGRKRGGGGCRGADAGVGGARRECCAGRAGGGGGVRAGQLLPGEWRPHMRWHRCS